MVRKQVSFRDRKNKLHEKHEKFQAAKYDIKQHWVISENFFIRQFLTAIENARFEIY